MTASRHLAAARRTYDNNKGLNFDRNVIPSKEHLVCLILGPSNIQMTLQILILGPSFDFF